MPSFLIYSEYFHQGHINIDTGIGFRSNSRLISSYLYFHRYQPTLCDAALMHVVEIITADTKWQTFVVIKAKQTAYCALWKHKKEELQHNTSNLIQHPKHKTQIEELAASNFLLTLYVVPDNQTLSVTDRNCANFPENVNVCACSESKVTCVCFSR